MKKAVLLFGLIAVLFFSGCSEKKSDEKAQKQNAVVRIGAQPYPLYAPLFAAKNLGYIDEELAKVNASYTWTEFKAGPLVNEAVASGNADIGIMADMPAILAKSSGQDIQIFSHIAYGEKALALVVKNDSPISEVGQIKGKKIAYVKGSYAQHLLALLLKNNSLSFSDITSVNLGAGDIPAALENGDIDGAVVWEQYISLLVVPGKAKVIADGSGIKKGNNVAYVVKSFGDKHPDVLAAFIKANQRGADYINEHPKEAAELIAKNFGIEPALLEVVFKNFVYYAAFSDDDIAEITKVKNYILAEKIIQNDVDISQFVTTKYIKQAGL
ncbi:MAG: aliphatic sulfonate ABC transporter substrate-binding protein [Campylobacteraceae bacterium]|jgi:sulfonate transport system substrate-binding protein|nr:aliphatic sulfonate ABC transporter substrate-binding protein [Campylobacteraceae bacterium]